MTCCSRRSEDGIVDRQNIENAVAGKPATLSPTEGRLTIWRLRETRGWGLNQIAAHTGYSKSRVAAVLAETRKHGSR